jgi:hypothetical protein
MGVWSGRGSQVDAPFLAEFVHGNLDHGGELAGGLAAEGVVVAEEAGDGSGTVEDDGGDPGVVDGGEIAVRGYQVGEDAVEGDPRARRGAAGWRSRRRG